MQPIVLHTFKTPITIRLEGSQLDEALKLLNLHYVQDEQCNKYEDGKIIPKYPEFQKDHPEFVESHYAVCRSTIKYPVDIELLSDGTLRLKHEHS